MVKLILDKSSKKHQETSMKHPGPFWSSQKMETNDVTKNDILVVFFNIPIPTNKIEVSCTWLLFPPAPSEPHVTTRPSARTAAKASRLQSTTTTGTMGTMGTMGTKHQKRKKKLGVSSFDAWSLVTLMVGLGSFMPYSLQLSICTFPWMKGKYASLPFGATWSQPDLG